MIEQLARVPVEVDYASEFRYRDPVLERDDLLIVISQSGETADTIAAMREAKSLGCKVLAVCNVQGSMIHREADGTILTHAGPGDRCRVDKGFHGADGRALSVRAISRPASRQDRRATGKEACRGPCASCR